MKKQMICIACPIGCILDVEYEGKELISVTGYTCPRGKTYAETEISNPQRVVTSTVKLEGGRNPVVPVKTSKPIDKALIFDCMKEINKAIAKAPVKIGDVIIPNVLGTGADIVATAEDLGK
ncbi:MAG TPA: DUF1667 domain-containing protein [Clostridiales bacterium]|nr:DUF1667 domain-containing protein [Clostridiales bacterium]HOJ35584.1 DUF1667 domain-containing protein [Clostridiales bacterium]HOL79383.1 DUF1667 domain-containing protein [Clostridiales bacterium]HPP68618.1 DUF1667 domain-containing protein [Clostridiales bacterium]HPU66901.1 DUF1667 domain-containing protein [Clostridiales bacterium]